jgi:putative FmdB family regulatory protein
MTHTTRRPTLHLKNPPARTLAPAAVIRWKCKPCGAPFEVSQSLDDDEAVRCPACNARLGRADQFRSALAPTPGVRARRA